MGQKTSPIGFRLARNKKWRSVWFANKQEFGSQIGEDLLYQKNFTSQTLLLRSFSNHYQENER